MFGRNEEKTSRAKNYELTDLDKQTIGKQQTRGRLRARQFQS